MLQVRAHTQFDFLVSKVLVEDFKRVGGLLGYQLVREEHRITTAGTHNNRDGEGAIDRLVCYQEGVFEYLPGV